MPPATSTSPASAKVPPRVAFDSDDSSSSDSERIQSGGDSLSREMAAAAERQRRKNPHAESGRARLPRPHPLAPSGRTAPTASSTAVPYKAKKVDLFCSDSSTSDEEDAENLPTSAGETLRSNSSTSPLAPTAPGRARCTAGGPARKAEHVQGICLRVSDAAAADGKKRQETQESEEDNGSSDENSGLHINKAYATRYEEQKRKQELHTLAEKYKGKLGKIAAFDFDNDEDGTENSSDDEEAEEDDDAVLLTRENNISFAKALLAVRKATVPLRVGRRDTKNNGVGVDDSAADHKDSPTSHPDTDATVEVLLPKEELLKERFFPPAEEQIRVNTDVFERRMKQKQKKEAKKKRFTLSDEYKRSLKATAESEDAVVDDSNEAGERDGLRKLRPQSEEEAKLRAAFLRNVEDSASTFEVVRGATAAHASAPTAESTSDEDSTDESVQSHMADDEKQLLETAFALGISTPAAKKKKKQSTTDGATEDDNEVFLRDFFIQELWRPGVARKKKKAQKGSAVADEGGQEEEGEEGEEGPAGSYYDRLAQLAREEEDDTFFSHAEVWEREYQDKKYRHQEAEEETTNGGVSAAHVQTFPRPIGDAVTGLLRKSDTARKDARQRRRERAEAARTQQIEELKRLKHLKRKEIEDQRALIASVAGLKTITADDFGGDAQEEAELAKLKAVWSDQDLSAPFDPEEFDRKMAQLFNDDYYNEKNVDEDEIAYFDEELDKEHNEDEMGTAEDIRCGEAPALFAASSLEEALSMAPAAAVGENKNKESSAEVFFNDDFGPSQVAGTSDAVSLLYPSEALKQLEKERQQLNNLIASSSGKRETNAELLERLQASLKQKEEEYYELHRNAGAASSDGAGVSGGFRYREVPPEDFTLSIEEILALDDRQLNMIAPMNCYAAYLDKESNERDRHRIERRRQKGFRQVDSDRTSRRYGNVKSTAVLNPEQINDVEGEAIAESLSKRLREEGEDPDAPLETPQYARSRGRGRGGAPAGWSRDASSSRGKWPRTEGRGRGGRGSSRAPGGASSFSSSSRGGQRGRGRGR